MISGATLEVDFGIPRDKVCRQAVKNEPLRSLIMRCRVVCIVGSRAGRVVTGRELFSPSSGAPSGDESKIRPIYCSEGAASSFVCLTASRPARLLAEGSLFNPVCPIFHNLGPASERHTNDYVKSCADRQP